MEALSRLLERATQLLDRIDAQLPPALPEHDWSAPAYRWTRSGAQAGLVPLPQPAVIDAALLSGIAAQREALFRNVRQFVKGRPANNVLLTGARGTGKSSLVRALLPEFAGKGLRLIEVERAGLADLPQMAALLSGRPERFVLFCDDLSFDEGDGAYRALKVALDGGLSAVAGNMLVIATSNRRHLFPEQIDDNRRGGEIHPGEAVDEVIALSDRFGLWLSFYPFSQDDYLAAAASWCRHFGIGFDETAQRAALQWSMGRGGRSGRIAWQFARDWAGRTPSQRKIV